MLTKIEKHPFLVLPHLDPHSRAIYRDAKARGARLVASMRRRVTAKRIGVAVGGGLLLLFAVNAAFFFTPRSVAFSYSGDSCFVDPMLLPGVVHQKPNPTFKVAPVKSVAIGGYPLYSHTTCITPTAAPAEKMTEALAVQAPGNLFTKTIRVSAGALPTIAQQAPLDAPVPTRDPLVFALDNADSLFAYQLVVGEQKLGCAKQNLSVTCNVSKLQLAQSAQYSFVMQRLFKGAPAGIIFERAVTTVEAVRVTSASIEPDQTIYGVPTQLTLTLNKAAKSAGDVHLYLLSGDNRQEVATKASLADTTITVSLQQPLERSASFVLTVDKLAASDGGYLAPPFSLPFKTSGGPKVVGINIGSVKVQPAASIVITFDSNVSASQALGDVVRIEANGGAVAASVSGKGRTITIKPHSSLPGCTSFTVKVLNGLQNEFGIAGGSAWQLKSRTICQTAFSIGTSVQGRSITAYRFGNGASKIIFVGTTHGDEKSSTYLLNRWIDYLETNYDSIPAGRTIVVIPSLNPDGYAASRRTNANNVDLNRNFPSNDWKQGVTMPDKSYNPNGGGSAPLSEPESSALASYVLAQNPRLVLTYHAAAGVVIPNDSGDSNALAHTYDQESNVGYASNGQTGEIFEYDTTGAFEDWLHDKHDIPALLVELWTKGGNEFSKHQTAMWAMIEMP